MKKIGLFLLMSGTLLIAQQPDIEITDGWRNGRFWAHLDTSWKLGFIIGYQEGVSAGAAVMMKNNDTANVIDTIHTLTPHKLTYGEIIKAVDRFYADPLNAIINIPTALEIIADEAAGAAPERIAERIRKSRAETNGPKKDKQ
jgi:hypothetical protein